MPAPLVSLKRAKLLQKILFIHLTNYDQGQDVRVWGMFSKPGSVCLNQSVTGDPKPCQDFCGRPGRRHHIWAPPQ